MALSYTLIVSVKFRVFIINTWTIILSGFRAGPLLSFAMSHGHEEPLLPRSMR